MEMDAIDKAKEYIEECGDTYPDANEIIDIIEPEFRAMQRELEELRDWKADVEESYRKVMQEKCPTDEQHCTCVPILRAEIKKTQRVCEAAPYVLAMLKIAFNVIFINNLGDDMCDRFNKAGLPEGKPVELKKALDALDAVGKEAHDGREG